MAALNCYITTFNCGRKMINVPYFAANFFNGVRSSLPPDLVVLCLEEIAPIGYAFLGGSLLTPYFALLVQAVKESAALNFGKDGRYTTVILRNVGMTAIAVFALPEVEHKIRWIETAGVGVGLWDMGNKGGVGVRMGMKTDGEEAIFTWVAAHLAPMENAWERRNRDWKSICEGLVFERVGQVANGRNGTLSGECEPLLSANSSETLGPTQRDHSLFYPASYIIFAGDLNYRTSDSPPSPNDNEEWPQPTESPSDPRHWSHTLPKDQLNRERIQKRTLHHLTEAPIEFGPTYKFSNTAQKNAMRNAEPTTKRILADGRAVQFATIQARTEEDSAWLWAKHRTPSWCDRILFLEAAKPKVHAYTTLPVQPTSDHRPVALSCSFPLEPLKVLVESPVDIKPDWRERRAMARRLEFLVGLAAYLGLTWEGEALLGGTVVGILGGYWAIHALLAAQ